MSLRLLFALSLGLAVGCGLTFSPGDFGAPDETNLDAAASPEAQSSGDVGSEPSPDATSPAGLHLLLFAGTKEGGDSNEVMTAPIAENGDLGAFTYLAPTPLLKPLQAVGFAGGKIFTAAQGATGRVVQSADFAGGFTSAWASTVVPNSPTSAYGSFFAGSSLVVLGGQTTRQEDDGAGGTVTVTTIYPELRVNKRVGADYPEPHNVVSETKLPVGIQSPTIVLYKNFVFFGGPGSSPDQAAKVYVGTIDETLGLTSITEASTVQDGTPTSAVACAGEGRLFLLGGSGNSLVTRMADIDEVTGALGAWRTGPNLPVSRTLAACAVIKGAVHVFGGRLGSNAPDGGANKPTSAILRARIGADGTMSEWETLAQTLPGARSNVFALTY